MTMNYKNKCCLCGTRKMDVLNLGEMKECKNLHAHYYCLLLASTIKQSGADEDGILGFLPSDITAELKQSQKRICVYCNMKGASVLCNTRNCKIMFHLPCGIKNDSGHQFYGRFLSHCVAHRPKQKYVTPKERQCCPICYELINFRVWTSVLWAPCCKKKSYFHKTCIQQMALSAGYFFKCPICNNTNIFQRTMKHFGVFIPDRDASWELVPNAFQELLYRHEECNVERCFSSKGRSFNGVGVWTIVLCNTCGSQGTHMNCSKLKKDEIWNCPDCNIEKDSKDVKTLTERSLESSSDINLNISQPSTSRDTVICNSSAETTAKRRKRKRGQEQSLSTLYGNSNNNINGNNLIEIDSDSDVMVIDDENEPSCKCLLAKDGSLLRVRNIARQEGQFGILGDLDIEKQSQSSNTLMNVVISDVRSLLDSSDHDSHIKDASAIHNKNTDNNDESLNNSFVLYTTTDHNNQKTLCFLREQQDQVYVMKDVIGVNIFNADRVVERENNQDVGNYSKTPDNEIVIID